MPEQLDEIGRLRTEIEALTRRVQALEQASGTSLLGPSPRVTDPGGWALRIANRVGGFTVVLGVLFFFKYAVDEHLIGAFAGIWLALVLGIGFVVAGEWFYRRALRVLAQGLTGTGLATVFTVAYASFAYYKLISEWTGFAGLIIVCVASVLLSLRYETAAIAFLGFLGALWTPVLLSERNSNLTLKFSVFSIVMAAVFFVAQRMRWVSVTPLMTAVALLCAGLEFGGRHVGLLLLYALALSAASFGIAARAESNQRSKAGFLVAGHLAFVTAGGAFVQWQAGTASVRSELDSVLLACYGLILLLLGSIRALNVEKAFGSVLLGVVVMKLYLLDIWSLARIYRVSAFIGLGALLLVASYLYSRSDRNKAST